MSNEAIATWGGVAVTLVVAVWSLVLARRAERSSRADRNEREAARVSAWVAAVRSLADPHDVLVIRNASSAAIHDVHAVAVMNGRRTTFEAKLCPPGEHYARWNPPGSRFTWQFLQPCETSVRTDHGMSPFTRTGSWMLTALSFTDALGQRWEHRAGDGVHPVPDEEALTRPGS